ncbi:MAG: M48 family metallopeptidase [Planctomycetota bacterium]|nr:M48 family metallopeptidase [Planctomycetota bacterium]
MIIKLLILFLVIAALFYFPQYLPRLFRFLGARTGQAGRLGKELLTGAEVPDSVLAEIETGTGKILLDKALTNHPELPSSDQSTAVKKLGARLAAKAARQQLPFRFIIIDDPAPNACAIPGGSILISQPLIELCSCEDELAGVLAHEIQHIDRRHALNTLAKNFAAKKLLNIAGPMLRKAAETLEVHIDRGYQQDQEFEADIEGARLAKRAGFDPAGLANLLEKLGMPEPLENSLRIEELPYFSTHPPIRERVRRLRKPA